MATHNANQSSDVDAQCDCNTDEYHIVQSRGTSDDKWYSVKRCIQCGAEGRTIVTDDGYEVFGELYSEVSDR